MQLFQIARAVLCASILFAPGIAQGQPIPATPALEALWTLRELDSDFALSPDGDKIAIVQRRMDVGANVWRHELVLVDLIASQSRVIADAGDIILRSVDGRRSGAPIARTAQFSPDSGSIYFLANVAGAVELHRVEIDGRSAHRVAEFAGDVLDFSVLETGDLHVETATPHRALAIERDRVERLGFLADEAYAPGYARTPLPAEMRARSTIIIDGVTGAARAPAPSTRPSGGDARVQIAPLDPASAAHAPPLGLISQEGARSVRCSEQICQGALQAAWRRARAGGEIIFQVRAGHARSEEVLGAWRPGTAVRTLRRSHDRLSGCRPREPMLICVQDEARQPKRIVGISLSDGRMRVLYDPNPDWSRLRVPRVERLRFIDQDGNESFADLVYPHDYRRARTYPLVIVQYRSRGFLAGGVGGETPIYALAARGYAVLSLDRPEFHALEAALPLADVQRTIELSGSERAVKRAALKHFIAILIERGLVDATRVGITGFSDGAETLYAMLMDEPALFAAAVASTPPTDPAGWWLNAPAYRARSFERLALTAPWESGPSPWTPWWIANSAALHASVIRTPLLMNLSETEALRAFPLITRLREAGRPIEAFIYPGAHHVKSRPAHIVAAQLRTLAWLDYWLLRRPPPANQMETAGAHERWASMRAALAQEEGALP